MNCPDCKHHWHSARCFYTGMEKGHLKQCVCPGSPSLMELGRRLKEELDADAELDRTLLTFEGVKEFFRR